MWVVDKVEFRDVDELIIAKGDNLQERKRLLWEACDCVVVLPGRWLVGLFGCRALGALALKDAPDDAT